ncbi:MAG: Lrp/AsnC family transcriptional regulator [Candidatus Micrarchaeia archaeon]
MDQLDSGILSVLKENARERVTEIAKRFKVSEGTVRNRVCAMEKRGDIKGYSVILGSRIAGVNALAFLKTLPQAGTTNVMEKVKNVDGVQRAWEVAGEFDACCLLNARDIEQLNEFLEQIRKTKGVLDTKSFSILKEV